MRGSIAARPAPPAETFPGTNRSERRKCEILLTLPTRNTTLSRSQTWGHSSAGRAPAWHAGGRRFDPAWLHHNLSVDQRPIDRMMQVSASPSSRGLGHHPFTVDTGVRIPVGTPLFKQTGSSRELPVLLCARFATRHGSRRSRSGATPVRARSLLECAGCRGGHADPLFCRRVSTRETRRSRARPCREPARACKAMRREQGAGSRAVGYEPPTAFRVTRAEGRQGFV